MSKCWERRFMSYYRSGNMDASAGLFQPRACSRVWKVQRFSWWMTALLHRFDTDNAFDQGSSSPNSNTSSPRAPPPRHWPRTTSAWPTVWAVLRSCSAGKCYDSALAKPGAGPLAAAWFKLRALWKGAVGIKPAVLLGARSRGNRSNSFAEGAAGATFSQMETAWH